MAARGTNNNRNYGIASKWPESFSQKLVKVSRYITMNDNNSSLFRNLKLSSIVILRTIIIGVHELTQLSCCSAVCTS